MMTIRRTLEAPFIGVISRTLLASKVSCIGTHLSVVTGVIVTHAVSNSVPGESANPNAPQATRIRSAEPKDFGTESLIGAAMEGRNRGSGNRGQGSAKRRRWYSDP